MNSVLITPQERHEYRAAIKQFDRYIDQLNLFFERETPVPIEVHNILCNLTGTQDISGQRKALISTRQVLNEDYDSKLAYAAQFKYSPFCEYMFRNEPPVLHQEFIIDRMEAIHSGELLRLGIALPPGAAKTTYASIRFAAWHLGRKPEHRWLQGAHTQTFAKDQLGKPVRDLMREPRYRDVFPDIVLDQASQAADFFKFAGHKGYYKAFGVGTSCAGYRAEIIGVDDPFGNREEAESETSRRKLHTWFEDDFGTRGSNPRVPIFVVNTRWHEDDLVGHELQKMKEGRTEYDWEIINIPALAEENDPLGRAEGVGLWPENFGTAFYLGKKRSLTSRSWNSLYQGNPTDEDGGVLSKSDVSTYKEAPANVLDANGNVLTRVIKHITLSVDCAEKATERSDYTAGTIWAETMTGYHYMIHASRIKAEFLEMVKWIEELAVAYNVDEIMVEDRGAGTQYIQIRKQGNGPAPVTPIATKQQDKVFRFDGCTPLFKTGVALLPEGGNTWLADVEAEMYAFPNSRNDDYVDTVSQYLNRVRDHSYRGGARRMRAGLAKG